MKIVTVSREGQMILSCDELSDFSALGINAFSFWDNPEDDIYDEFYKDILF